MFKFTKRYYYWYTKVEDMCIAGTEPKETTIYMCKQQISTNCVSQNIKIKRFMKYLKHTSNNCLID